MHASSNGGTQCAAQVVAAEPPSCRANAFGAFVLYSCSGLASYARSANAVLLTLAPSPVLKLLALPFVHVLLCLISIADRVFGSQNVVVCARRRLEAVDHTVLRLDIHSSADDMVPAQDVRPTWRKRATPARARWLAYSWRPAVTAPTPADILSSTEVELLYFLTRSTTPHVKNNRDLSPLAVSQRLR